MINKHQLKDHTFNVFLILKIFQHKVYIKGMKFLVKARGKVVEGGCTTFFQGPLFKSWKLKSLWGVALGERISVLCLFFVKPK